MTLQARTVVEVLPLAVEPDPTQPTVVASGMTDSFFTSGTTVATDFRSKQVTVPDCEVDDLIVIGGVAANDPTTNLPTVTTNSGSTGSWTLRRVSDGGTNDVQLLAGLARVTGAGNVTFTVEWDLSGMTATGDRNGFWWARVAKAGNLGFSNTTASTTQTTTASGTTTGSMMWAWGADWNAAAIRTAATPTTAATFLFSQRDAAFYTLFAAYWFPSQGNVAYGSSGAGTLDYKHFAFELLPLTDTTATLAASTADATSGFASVVGINATLAASTADATSGFQAVTASADVTSTISATTADAVASLSAVVGVNATLAASTADSASAFSAVQGVTSTLAASTADAVSGLVSVVGVNATLAASTGASVSSFTAVTAAGGPNGRVRVWDGAAWVTALVKVWDGAAWQPALAKSWDGAAWVTSNG